MKGFKVVVLIIAISVSLVSCDLFHRDIFTGTEMPVFSTAPGTYPSGQPVSLSFHCATPNAAIAYTLDGSTPTPENGIVFDGEPVVIPADTTVKAVAYVGGNVSFVNCGYYRFGIPSTVLNIGDRGPAGGRIVYDKGDYDGGWRYLEAAPPSSVEQGLIWGWGGGWIDTDSSVGAGYENTVNILNFMGADGAAAMYCWNYEHGGYEDWFLPSYWGMEELIVNLGVGDEYPGGSYWTSTDPHEDGWACVISSKDGHGSSSSFFDKKPWSWRRTLYTLPVRRF